MNQWLIALSLSVVGPSVQFYNVDERGLTLVHVSNNCDCDHETISTS